MNNQLRSNCCVFIISSFSLFGVNLNSAIIANVQFSNSGPSYTGSGIIGSSGDYWNNLGGSGSGISLKNTGNTTIPGLSITWTSDGVYSASGDSGFNSTSYANLMDGMLYSLFSHNITLSGLTPNTDLELYLYSQGDSASDGRRLGITANGISAITSPAVSSASTFTLNQNYLKMNVQSDSSGILSINYSASHDEANVNGFQLAAVPEPKEMSMAVAMALGVLAILRRNIRPSNPKNS